MAVFKDEIILNQIGGGAKYGLRALRLPKGMVKLPTRHFLRAIMLADGARRFNRRRHRWLATIMAQKRGKVNLCAGAGNATGGSSSKR
jgi:hypothetical protein